MMQDLEGITFSSYQIQSRLARGGMGEIYLARDLRTGQAVAIKMVHRSAEEYYERFRREVTVLALLKHDYILPALDCGEYDAWYYLVTPYIERGTLQDRLVRGPIGLEEAGKFLAQLADALQFAHEKGILHRDIKASNVLLRDQQHVYLADFGLVKSIEDDYSITQSGHLVGTPEYMAPELADVAATPASDIYALGILLYQMLTGRVPFNGGTPVAILLKHIQEPIVPPSALNSLIPASIDEVVLRALEKDPRQRFQKAHDLLLAYQQAFDREMSEMTVHVAAVRPVAVSNVPLVSRLNAPAVQGDPAFAEFPTIPKVPMFAEASPLPGTPAFAGSPTVSTVPAPLKKAKRKPSAAIVFLVVGLLFLVLLCLSAYSVYSRVPQIVQPPSVPHVSPTNIVRPTVTTIGNPQNNQNTQNSQNSQDSQNKRSNQNNKPPASQKHHHKKNDTTTHHGNNDQQRD